MEGGQKCYELDPRPKPMDVRCERCQTEYEVEDASVSDLGTEVQCSDCGHLFMVKRPAGQAPVTTMPASSESNGAPGWQLVTTFGQTHDVRDLTQLHKWIIERRVTRNDKISADGQSWQTLGSMAELVPFFDIVDSAERARIIDTLPVAPLAPLQPPILTPHEVEPPADAKPGQSAPQLLSPYVLGGSAGDSLGALPQATDVGETEMIAAKPARSRQIFKIALMVAVAGGIGYGGIVWQRQYLRPAVISSSGSAEEQGVEAKVQAATVTLPSAPVAVASVEDEAQAEAAGERGHVPMVQPLDGAAAPETLEGEAVPQSAAAQGYAALNRREFVEAIAFFKEALSEKPGNGTALFGLAEAYRGAGRATHALQTYRRYVKGLPFGPDAGSARFHIRTLEKLVKQRSAL
jgi:predicted Zn finger-like uncharacterized protein